MMAISLSELEFIIKQNFPNANIKITDMLNDQEHYSIEISDSRFEGKSLIEQHKMVKDSLKEVLLQKKLHAITIKTIVNSN